MANDNFFEEIPEDDMPKHARGRKPNPDTLRVRDALLNLKKGKALRMVGLAFDLNGKNEDQISREKARIGAVIRAGAGLANVKVSVIFDAGVPTVKVTGTLPNNG